MALANSYLVTTKNLESLFNSIQSANAPEKFTNKFLENLELTSSNDRLYIRLLKDLGFVSEDGTPTERYYSLLDPSEARRGLADAIREAYGDLFAINKNAQKLDPEEIKGKLKKLTLGKKSEHVIALMANTFKALCDYADWSVQPKAEDASNAPKQKHDSETEPVLKAGKGEGLSESPLMPSSLHYNVQIHLPESRDPAVFDAIFQALRKHLT